MQSLAPMFVLLRPVYWAKNLLIFVPAYLAAALQQPDQLMNCFFGFVLFCLCASGTYVFNDWIDAEKDAAHITKKTRPLPSGLVSRNTALAFATLLVASSLFASAIWRAEIALWLVVYAVMSFIYTIWFKNIFLLDGLWLSVLHLLRLWFGAVIVEVTLSPALIAFSLLFFFSLSMAKRYGEMTWMIAQNLAVETGRPYQRSNKASVLVFGSAAAGAAVGILFLYAARYFPSTPDFLKSAFLWVAAVVVGAWLFYMWISAWHGLLTTDPIAFALKDRISLFFLIFLLGCLVLSRELTIG